MSVRRSLRRDDRGAVAVEAALILPIFMVLILGIMEWAMLMTDYSSVTEMSRVGVRTASAHSRQTGFTRLTVDAIAQAGTAVKMRNVDFILVYKANDRGYPGANGSTTMSCSGYETSCDRYVWRTDRFVLSPSTTPWNPISGVGQPGNVNACPVGSGGPTDSVGVYVQVTHAWFTGFFGSSKKLGDRAVLPFEPRQVGACQ